MIKKYSVYPLSLLLLINLFFLCISGSNISAADCTTTTFYSVKEWVTYQNFYDIPWSDGQEVIVNSHDKSSVVNALGTWSWPTRKGSAFLLGEKPYSVKRQNNSSDPFLFQASFSDVKIKKFTYEISAVDADGNSLEKRVLINAEAKDTGAGKVDFQGTELQRTSDSERQTITIPGDVEVSNVMIVFDTQNVEDVYTLTYFQVDEYQIYEHSSWTTTYIPDTETRKETVCTQSGKFTPDGSDGWQRSAYTTHSPSTTSVINYDPSFITQEVVEFDFRKELSWNANQPPDGRFNSYMGGYATQITGWDSDDGYNFQSRGSGGIAFPYINTSSNTGIRYVASPTYWSPYNIGGYWSESDDRGWCNDTTGQNVAKCYKYGGHVSNARWNTWDVSLQRWSNTVTPDDRYVSKVDYFLYNKDTGITTFLKTSTSELESFTFEETGRWQIKGNVYDKQGNKGETSSKEFLIDREAPTADFSPTPSGTYVDDLQVTITPRDRHSGVKKWRYSLSADEGLTYPYVSNWFENSNAYNLILNSTGNWKIKVDVIDNVGNTGSILSGVYCVLKAEVEAKEMYAPSYTKDATNKVYANIGCIDCTGLESVNVKLYQDDVLVKEMNESFQGFRPFELEYVPTQNGFTSIKLETNLTGTEKKSELKLNVFEKTYDKKETSESSLYFTGVTVSSISNLLPQKDYYEELTLNVVKEKDKYYSGESVRAAVEVQYTNECDYVIDFACQYGAISSYADTAALFVPGKAEAVFEDGAEPVREIYKNGNEYKVPIEFDKTKKTYLLPEMYVAQRSGKVYNKETVSEAQEKIIFAGNTWFTNLKSEIRTYNYTFEGKETGVNEFEWVFRRTINISEYIQNLYKLRFVDPENPFPNEVTEDKEVIQSWISSLDFDNPINTFEVIQNDK